MSNKAMNFKSENRNGLHYIPDFYHYRQKDLDAWLPHLQSLGISWLVLKAPQGQAIPEYFISGLVKEGIQPIVQMDFSLESPPKSGEIAPLLEAYAHWGVNYPIFFDRPNIRQAWPSSGWARQDLIERFLDRFVPLASLAIQHGMQPVFPALEPGGDYWDIAFLKSCLQSLENRHQSEILDNLVLAAYAHTMDHDLNWGSGGPDRWPEARPYHSSDIAQDQRGFRIFDWYNAIIESVTGSIRPIILLESGKAPHYQDQNELDFSKSQAGINLAIYRLLANDIVENPADPQTNLDPLPANILSSNFWLLTTPQSGEDDIYAWFGYDQTPSITVQAVVEFQATLLKNIAESQLVEGEIDSRPGEDPDLFDPSMDFDEEPAATSQEVKDEDLMGKAVAESCHQMDFIIQHYVLLPSYDWGIADFYLDAVRPFVKKYRATVGFSLQEAAAAEYVTVIGDQDLFSDEALDKLRFNGSVVERISGDGTTIASVLAQR
jgi:hypothetical protein